MRMSTKNETVSEYNDRLNNRLKERVSWMDVRKWKVIQSLLISAVIVVVGLTGGMSAEYIVLSLVAVNTVLGVDYAALKEVNVTITDDKKR